MQLTGLPKPSNMKLIVHCMECDGEIVIGDMVAELIEAWNPHFETHTMCDDCISAKFNIDPRELKALSDAGKF